MRLSMSVVGEAESAAVRRVICEDGYLGMGAEVQRFEQELAAYLGVAPSLVCTVNSGTAAVHLAVQAATTPGGEVLVPSLTFVASFQAISGAGAVPVACDVRADTGTIDLDDAEARLTPKTQAIMAVHYASNPAFLEETRAFAKRHKLRLIEDAAHAFGCTYKGQRIGSTGDLVCFSFDGIKNITCGEGGLIVAFDEASAEICKDGRLLSVAKDTEKRFSGSRSWDFDVERQGWRYHMSNIMAAVGRVQLARFEPEFAPARKALAAQYRARLAKASGIALFTPDPHADIVPHIFPVRILNAQKPRVWAALEAAQIPVGLHYKPNHLLSFYAPPAGARPFPITEELHSQLITLPLHPNLTKADIDLVCGTLLAALHGAM